MHYKGRPYLPKSFKDNNHIEEIQGVYVPFWMFDGKASGEASYKATTSKVYEKGDEEITETRHYEVSRAGPSALRKFRWMRHPKCRMIIWIPSNPMITPG